MATHNHMTITPTSIPTLKYLKDGNHAVCIYLYKVVESEKIITLFDPQ